MRWDLLPDVAEVFLVVDVEQTYYHDDAWAEKEITRKGSHVKDEGGCRMLQEGGYFVVPVKLSARWFDFIYRDAPET